MRNIRVEFLLEESSMENFLPIILPKILPNDIIINQNCFLRPHNGKSDLIKSIPKKVKVFSGYTTPTKIIILHDQDTSDCYKLKSSIEKLINSSGDCEHLIRIPCRELEAWYLGDMDSIGKVFGRFKPEKYKTKTKFRNPDLCRASAEIIKICPDFQKGYASKNIPIFMDIEINKSPSFITFVSGVKKFLS